MEKEKNTSSKALANMVIKDAKQVILKIVGEPGEANELDEQFQEKHAKEEVKSMEESPSSRKDTTRKYVHVQCYFWETQSESRAKAAE